MRLKPRPRAFALLELIVILAVMALMLTLLAPAIQAARDSAEKNTSRNKIKQLGLALHKHAEAYPYRFPQLYFVEPKSPLKNKLSPLDATGMYTWQVQLLPYLEEDTLYKNISTASQKFTVAADKIKIRNAEGKDVSPSTITLSCLQAPQLGPNLKPGLCNYVALSATRQPLLTNVETAADGTQTFKRPSPDGTIIPDKSGKGILRVRIGDGTSRTAVACESRELERSNWFTPQEVFVCGFLPEDTTPAKDPADQFYPYFHGDFVPNPKINRTALNFGPTAEDPKLAYNADEKDPLRRTWGPSGGHAEDITIHVLGDGSVLEVPNNIDPLIYFAMITPHGSEFMLPQPGNLPPPPLSLPRAEDILPPPRNP